MNWTQEQYDLYLERMGKAQKPKRKSKYNARKTTVDGIKFDSAKEAEFYGSLKLLLRAGAIKGFCRQARFSLLQGDENTEYVADFVIFNNDGTCRIVDVKGVETDVFKLKMKMFKAQFPQLEVEIEKG